jgi:hypothetical protein
MAQTDKPQRRLSDLYVRGVPLLFTDDDVDFVVRRNERGEPLTEDGETVYDEVPLPAVSVWLAKPTSFDMDVVFKAANKASALMLAGRKDHESDTWLAIRDEVGRVDREVLVNELVARDLTRHRDVVEARVKGETVEDDEGEEQPSEWAKDGYLDSLRDAWLTGGLRERHLSDPDDDEASNVLAEIDRFTALVDAEYAADLEDKTLEIGGFDDETLIDKVTDLYVEIAARQAWAGEYRHHLIFLCTKQCAGPDPDRPGRCLCRGGRRRHAELYFESLDEVAALEPEIKNDMVVRFEQLIVEASEGKGSRRSRPSSTPSEPPAAEATSSSSGLVDASA